MKNKKMENKKMQSRKENKQTKFCSIGVACKMEPHRFGPNAKSVTDNGKNDMLMEVDVEYHCGCKYTVGCFDMGEGFDWYCAKHLEMEQLIQRKIHIASEDGDKDGRSTAYDELRLLQKTIKGL